MSANLQLLRDAAALVMSTSDANYPRIGPHIRHILDFYVSLLNGIEAGRIDYESRARDSQIERDRVRALDLIRGALRGLQRIRGDRGVEVWLESSETWATSSVARELDVAAGHTIHHFAIVAMTLRAIGIEPPPDLGVSPSTLRYRTAAETERRHGRRTP